MVRLRGRGLEWREVDGEVVALDVDASTYLAANPSGAVLWRALADGATRDDLAALLTASYGISGERAKADVDSFLAALGARGLLE